MNLHEAYAAVTDAKHTLNSADGIATAAAKLIVGRLRKVEDWDRETLKALKKELRDFNAATGKWKEEA